MKPLHLLIIVFLAALISCSDSTTEEPSGPQPPDADQEPKELTNLGDTRIDNYYWMKLTEEQRNTDNPDAQTQKVVKYLTAENEYRESVMNSAALEDELYTEMIGRIKQDDSSVPYFKNGYWYYSKFEEGFDYPVYCRKKGSMDASEEVILDANAMGKNYEFFSVRALNVSPDNKTLAFSIDTVSRRKYVIMFKDLTSGELYSEKIPLTGSAAWASDSRTYYYTKIDNSTLRDYQLYSHSLDTSPTEDKLILTEEDETYALFLDKSKSGKYLFLYAGKSGSQDVRYMAADDSEGSFKQLYPRKRGVEMGVEHFGNHFYFISNEDAVNFELYKTPVTSTAKDNWEVVIPHREDALIAGLEIFEEYMVVRERNQALTQLRVIKFDDGEEYYVDFEEEAYVVGFGANPEFNTNMMRIEYSSMTTPETVYDFNLDTKEKTVLKQQPVLGGFDPANYETKRLWATARDGVEVPITIVYKKGIKQDGNNPLLLYGYGSYGASMDPWFNSSRLSLLDRGFVYAVAHIRGGSEMGRQWYDNGKMYNKKNTFNDFVDCADFLVQENYTNPDVLFALGGSAGGLLMGAVINMRPDLWKGVVAAVPFVDVITTMLDESIPLTTFEYDEWGNPNLLEQYEYIKTYSPYDNVTDNEFPNVLVTTGFHDSQVQYWEPAKWVAKLRDHNTGDNKILLYTNMEAGHGGSSGRLKRYRDTARIYAFFISMLDEEQLSS